MTSQQSVSKRKSSIGKDQPFSLVDDTIHELAVHIRRGNNKFISESILPLILCVLCPFFIRSIVFICAHCHGSIAEFVSRLFFDPTMTLKNVLENFFYFQWHWPSALIMFGFIIYAIVMTALLPGKKYNGPITDSGHIPIYYDNGFIYYLVSLMIFAVLTIVLKLNGLTPTYIYDHFEEFLSTVNTFAFLLCFTVMLKGKYLPSTDDHRSSTNWLTDFYRGIELYPRVCNIDIKLITNCRYGMLSWALLCVIFCLKAFELYGYTDSSLVTCVLTLVYLTKFFWWESGYMKTMDIIVDRAGFYLCWGCLVWVSGLYTLPSYFLVTHPIQLGPFLTLSILILGLLSIYINYDCDRQKLDVRAANGQCTIWGKPARIIRAKYRLLNGYQSESILIASGYWNLSRHFHYIPELSLAFLWSCPCGFNYVLPYIYFIFLFVLLMHRAHRDDQKCTNKYGTAWQQYCKLVPWKIWPGLY
jgi:7-dehydrocholesterol reductase